jgi:hypothetical protein
VLRVYSNVWPYVLLNGCRPASLSAHRSSTVRSPSNVTLMSLNFSTTTPADGNRNHSSWQKHSAVWLTGTAPILK